VRMHPRLMCYQTHDRRDRPAMIRPGGRLQSIARTVGLSRAIVANQNLRRIPRLTIACVPLPATPYEPTEASALRTVPSAFS
jgi:hypothetical protein